MRCNGRRLAEALVKHACCVKLRSASPAQAVDATGVRLTPAAAGGLATHANPPVHHYSVGSTRGCGRDSRSGCRWRLPGSSRQSSPQ